MGMNLAGNSVYTIVLLRRWSLDAFMHYNLWRVLYSTWLHSQCSHWLFICKKQKKKSFSLLHFLVTITHSLSTAYSFFLVKPIRTHSCTILEYYILPCKKQQAARHSTLRTHMAERLGVLPWSHVPNVGILNLFVTAGHFPLMHN